MKFNITLALMLSLITQSMALTANASEAMTCEEQLDIKLERLYDSNRRSTNDLVMGLAFAVPVGLAFQAPLILAFVTPGIVYKAQASNRLNNAKRVKKMYVEAANGGGKQTRRIYRKIMKANPGLDLTYDQMLTEIHDQNMKGEACALEYPNNKEIINAILID